MKRWAAAGALGLLAGCATGDRLPVLDRNTEAQYARRPAWEASSPSPAPAAAPEQAEPAMVSGFEPRAGRITPPSIDGRSALDDDQTARPPGEVARREVAAAALEEVNALRREAGLSPLVLEPSLMVLAQAHVRSLAEREDVSSETADGRDIAARLEDAGLTPGAAGSFVVGGYPRLEDAVAVWMRTPEVRERLLSPGVTRAGFGLYQEQGSRYFSYIELIVAGP